MRVARLVREIATAALGRDPGPLAAVASDSHQVYVGWDAVMKVVNADGTLRELDRGGRRSRPDLPAGLTAPLLGSGLRSLGTHKVRCACYARVPGAAPGMGHCPASTRRPRA